MGGADIVEVSQDVGKNMLFDRGIDARTPDFGEAKGKCVGGRENANTPRPGSRTRKPLQHRVHLLPTINNQEMRIGNLANRPPPITPCLPGLKSDLANRTIRCGQSRMLRDVREERRFAGTVGTNDRDSRANRLQDRLDQ